MFKLLFSYTISNLIKIQARGLKYFKETFNVSNILDKLYKLERMFNYLHSIRRAHSKASNLLWRFTIHPHQLNNKFCLISWRHPHWSCLNTRKTEKIIASYTVRIHMLMLIFRIHNNNLPTEIYNTRH